MRPVFTKMNFSTAELSLQEVNCGCYLDCSPLGRAFRGVGLWELWGWGFLHVIFLENKTLLLSCFSQF